MSISISSTAEWFRCIGSTATATEHRAALAKLVRMLAGDGTRTQPPVSLPGQRAPTLAAPVPVAPAVPRRNALRQAPPRGKLVTQPSNDADAREPYTHDQLARMDARFVHRVERAIARGKEQPHA